MLKKNCHQVLGVTKIKTDTTRARFPNSWYNLLNFTGFSLNLYASSHLPVSSVDLELNNEDLHLVLYEYK